MTDGEGPARAAVLIGNPRPGSRTYRLAIEMTVTLLAALAERGVDLSPPAVVDLAPLGPQIGDWGTESPVLGQATDIVCSARLAVIASPTFKGTYTGLLKMFLDRLPRTGLEGVVVVPLSTAHHAGHAQNLELALRPVLRELGAVLPVPGVCVLEHQLGDVGRISAHWLERHAAALVSAVRTPAPAASAALAPGRRS